MEIVSKQYLVSHSSNSPSDFFLDTMSLDTRRKDDEIESRRRITELANAYQKSDLKKCNEFDAEEWLAENKAFDFTLYLRENGRPKYVAKPNRLF
jgi:hypothetical protein